MWLLNPLIYFLGSVLLVFKGRPWEQSLSSARNWLRWQLVDRFEPSRRQPFVRLLLDWWRFYWRPDLIHIHGYTNDLLFVIDWGYTRGIPVIYEEHQTPDAQFDWWKDFAKSINKASTVVAVSEKSAQALREVCGVTQPIEVAYYMVPDPVESGWAIDDCPSKGDESIRVTTNARLYVTKGLTYLLEAITKVIAVYPTTQFRVYGDGPLRDEMLAYAEQLGLDGNKIFVGAFTSREELSQIMAQTDIFVMSSILEGLPIAMLEAMAYGRPIVVTPVGGIPEAIEDGINGLLCMPRDPECLAEKICSLIEDPDLRRRLGHAARKSYEQGPFKPASVCSQYISIYKKVLSAKAP
jgi:glycosyltransferase involved in cell wall biosynthesis